MEFPAKAKAAIANAFYDKKIEVLEKTEAFDDEGGLTKSSETVKCTFKGNVRFLVQEEQQSGIGLVKHSDIQITCAANTEVSIDDLLRYAGATYIATSVLPSDSHLTILGDLWVKQ